MADYRIYCLDGAGRVHLADWIEANNADEAIETARKLRRDAQRCEVWLKDKLVAKISDLADYEQGMTDSCPPGPDTYR